MSSTQMRGDTSMEIEQVMLIEDPLNQTSAFTTRKTEGSRLEEEESAYRTNKGNSYKRARNTSGSGQPNSELSRVYRDESFSAETRVPKVKSKPSAATTDNEAVEDNFNRTDL